MSDMSSNYRGYLNVLLIPFIMLCLFLVSVSAFSYWVFNSREDYKNNVDEKVSAAVAVAQKQTEAADAKNYAQVAKQPLATFSGPATFGSIIVKYPKTWSAYVAEEPTSNTPIEGYFYPAIVPDVTNDDNSYALRIELIEEDYSTFMQNYSSGVSSGQIEISPYTLPKMPKVIGSMVQGQITQNQQGTMVVVPLLNMTLEVWTESSQFQSDFVNDVLPTISFQP